MSLSLTKQSVSVLNKLAELYGFNAEEAIERLSLSSSSSSKKEILKKPEVCIPFVKKVDTWCDGLKMNHGLFTQCTNKPMRNGSLCSGCNKQAKEGMVKCGLASEREREGEEWRDPKGRMPVKFGKIFAKMKLEREKVEEEMRRIYGEDNYEEWFVMEKTEKRGRPKKNDEEKKQRGRPKKTKEVIAESEEEDLIESLIAEAKAETPRNNEEEVMTPAAPTKKRAVRKTKEEKEAEKAAKEAKKAEKEAEKAAKKTEKEAKKAETITEELECENPEEEEVNAVRRIIGGEEYAVDEDNIVYDLETEEQVGVWDEENDRVVDE